MKTLLITGVSGFLGWHIYQKTRSSWASFGTYLNHNVNSNDPNLIKVNLTDLAAVKELFQQIKPDAVIHGAAQSKPNLCQEFPQASEAINLTASLEIARLCSQYQIPLVFTSTDLVFDGKNAPYSEHDPVSPVTVYGEQKVAAEKGILAIYPRAAICRMPLMFGSPSPSANSFLQPFLKTLQEGKELSLFTDEYRTAVGVNSAVNGLLLALEKVQGIIHLGGKERVSRYQFGLLMAAVFNIPREQIKPCLQCDFPMIAPRPQDVSLDSSLAFSLGYQPLSNKTELEAIRDEII
jgi:dTDP-4-dehydrorhamnose reductase